MAMPPSWGWRWRKEHAFLSVTSNRPGMSFRMCPAGLFLGAAPNQPTLSVPRKRESRIVFAGPPGLLTRYRAPPLII
jgi:hypothetical protein